MSDSCEVNVLCIIKEGDVVARISHNQDIYFKVTGIYTDDDGRKYARLKGLDIRLEATAPLDDLVMVDSQEVSHYWGKRQLEYMENIKYVCIRRNEERRCSYQRAMGEK